MTPRILLLSLLFAVGCAHIHPPRYEITSEFYNGRQIVRYLGRDMTTFENIEGWTGTVLYLTGFATFIGGFFAPWEDITLRNQVLGSALGATGFGILITLDSLGAFQELYEPRFLRRKAKKESQ